MRRSAHNTPPTAYPLLEHAREVLLGSPAWIDYLKRAYTVAPQGWPYMSYVGVNFTRQRVKNYKFYFAYSRQLTPAEIEVLLPVKDQSRFQEFYARWHPSRSFKAIHRGTTFAVKVDARGELTHYYHLRVPGLPFGPPERLTLAERDRNNYHGVCEEFTGSTVHLKRYFYCADRQTIADSVAIAGLPSSRAWLLDSLEYIESEGRDKFTWISFDHRMIRALFELRAPSGLFESILGLTHELGLDLFAPGSARDHGDHSIYLVHPFFPPSRAGNVFDGVRTFTTRYLGIDPLAG